MVELRSDTLTLPTAGMRQAMLEAEVGDDVWGEDPTVQALEQRAAEMLGQEAGLFCPSGTMTNQVALSVHLRPGDAVICADTAHIHLYEGGGIAANAGASSHTVGGDRGRFTAEAVEAAIQPDDPHAPRTRLVAVEDTSNRGGGAVWEEAELDAIAQVCRRRGLGLHLDGARVMNRIVASGSDPHRYGRRFDSISMCLSKGLGAPVGSVLMGSHPFIAEARRVRKRMGGGMRQAGFLAAAGLYALEHHVERLAEDHRRARRLSEALQSSRRVADVLPVETNIVIFALEKTLSVEACLQYLRRAGIQAAGMGERIRFVTHLGLSDSDIDRTVEAIRAFDSI